MGNCCGNFRHDLGIPLLDINTYRQNRVAEGYQDLKMKPSLHRTANVSVPQGSIAVNLFGHINNENDSPERIPRNILLSIATYNALVNGELG